MNDFVENLKRQAEENPLMAIGAAAALIAAASKLMNSYAWKREVARRTLMSKK